MSATVEVQTLRPLWFGGEVRPAGSVVALPRAEAIYLVGLGRAEWIVPAATEPTVDDLVGDPPAETEGKSKRKGG